MCEATRRKVLIADYDRDVARSLRMVFEREGFEVKLGHDSESVLAATVDWRPDVAILDYILADLNGIACGDKLRERYPDCKVIVLHSAFADHWIEDAQKRGYEVISKPVPAEVLLSAANAHP
jgi:DNA-binding NtrC family response regulator